MQSSEYWLWDDLAPMKGKLGNSVWISDRLWWPKAQPWLENEADYNTLMKLTPCAYIILCFKNLLTCRSFDTHVTSSIEQSTKLTFGFAPNISISKTTLSKFYFLYIRVEYKFQSYLSRVLRNSMKLTIIDRYKLQWCYVQVVIEIDMSIIHSCSKIPNIFYRLAVAHPITQSPNQYKYQYSWTNASSKNIYRILAPRTNIPDTGAVITFR